MFENLKEKREKERQNRLIKMAEENGIYVPPACGNYKPSKYGIGIGGWYTSNRIRAKIAEMELIRRGLI